MSNNTTTSYTRHPDTKFLGLEAQKRPAHPITSPAPEPAPHLCHRRGIQMTPHEGTVKKKKPVHLMLSYDTHRYLRVLAAHHDLSMKDYVEMMVQKEMQKLKEEYVTCEQVVLAEGNNPL